MTDNDNWFVVWIGFVEFIQIVSQERCGIRERIAGRVSEKPELIVVPNLGIVEQSIKHWHPGRGGVLQTMYEENGNFL